MPADQRSTLFLPNKHRFVTAGEDGQDVDYGDNWRALELWSRVVWSELPLLNGWTVWWADQPPVFCIDGFGFVHLRGIIQVTSLANTNFAVLPEGSRPAYLERIPITAEIGGAYSYNFLEIDNAGTMYATGAGLSAGVDVVAALSGSFSTTPTII